jgi:hypothetical protein
MSDINLLPKYAHHHGFWIVDNTVVYSKVKAVLTAQQKNTKDIRFYFHDNVYENCDWTKPQFPLIDLYISRAQQLRETYDYLVFAYSSGSDSSNALKTFLNNGIKIDELLVWYTSYNEKTAQTNAEINNAGSYMIEKCHKQYGIKINKIDIAQYFANASIVGSEWVLGADPSLVIEQVVKPQLLYNNPQWLQLADSGKRVAIILGLEKPRIFYDNGNWYSGFLDVTNAYNWEKYHTKSSPIVTEAFYITPDAPQITIAQSHAVANALTELYDSNFLIQNFSNDANFNQQLYFKVVRNTIYPYWNDTTFSIGKTRGGILIDKYDWAWNSNTQLSKQYFNGLELIKNDIDAYWLNNPHNPIAGLRGVWSKLYCLS